MLSMLYGLSLSVVAAVAGPNSALNYPALGGQPASARALGMGGAQRALTTEIDALVLNPAAMALKRHYMFGGTFAWSQDQATYRPGGALIDSETTFVAAGLGYGFERRDALAAGVMDVHRAHFALAYAYEWFSIGATVKYQRGLRYCMTTQGADNKLPCYQAPVAGQETRDINGAPIETAQPAPPDGAWNKNYEGISMDVGISLQPIPEFTFAVVGYNLIPKCKSFPNNCESREIAPMGLGIAAAGQLSDLALAADVVLDLQSRGKTQPRIHLGAEYAIVGVVPLRAGVLIDRVGEDTFWSAGAGYRHSSFGFDVGYHQGTQRPDNRTLQASFRVTLQ